MQEPEPHGDPYRHFGTDAYYRLAARYYWEVRTLADRGLLAEAFRTPLKRLNELRPQLHAP